MTMQKIILVAGPTASGKSQYALDLARQHDGLIINADALQVYEGLPILSAQPSREDQATIPHLLYGNTPAHIASSAGQWRTAALTAISEALASNKTPILVGGTGLYFRALLGGLADIPDIPPTVRQAASKLYDELGEATFRQRLSTYDPLAAQRLARNDRQRLIRAYEVAIHTGKPLSSWQAQGEQQAQLKTGEIITLPELPPLILHPHLIMPPREKLYDRCDNRFRQMIDNGVLDEVRNLLAQGIDIAAPIMKTIGAREIADYLNGNITLNQAIETAQQATRNYAKRQMTWFRNQWPSALRLE